MEEAARAQRREERAEHQAERKAARKAERELAEAKAQKARDAAAAVERLGEAMWRFATTEDDGGDTDSFSIALRGKKPESAAFFSEGIVDCTSWEPLEAYLRLEHNFNVPDVKSRLLLKAKLEVDGEARYFQSLRDATTLGSFWATCMDMGARITGAQEIAVFVTVGIAMGPTKLAKPKQPRCQKNTTDETKFKNLVKIVYGEHSHHYAEGEWTNEATEALRAEPGWVSKHAEMANLAEKVMGTSAYLHNPCVLICPFDGDKCLGAKHRLNRIGGISQLYSHWQLCHKGNPAARMLEKRWRKVLKARTIPVAKLNALPDHALELSSSWMESQGGMEQGYEQLRSLSAHASDADVWHCKPCQP